MQMQGEHLELNLDYRFPDLTVKGLKEFVDIREKFWLFKFNQNLLPKGKRKGIKYNVLVDSDKVGHYQYCSGVPPQWSLRGKGGRIMFHFLRETFCFDLDFFSHGYLTVKLFNKSYIVARRPNTDLTHFYIIHPKGSDDVVGYYEMTNNFRSLQYYSKYDYDLIPILIGSCIVHHLGILISEETGILTTQLRLYVNE